MLSLSNVFHLHILSVRTKQRPYTLGRFLAHASILCTVMGADQYKESFSYPGVGSTAYVIVPPRNQSTHFASIR